MFFPVAGGVPAVAKAEATSLLTLIAGEFATRVAALWPAPHAPFLTARAARRHLVCLALAWGRDAVAAAILEARLPHAIRLAAGPAPPLGLARAVSRMGDVAWTAADYRALAGLLRHRQAAKAIWHAEVLAPELVRALAALPEPMAGAVHLALGLDARGAAVLCEAYGVIRFRSGPAAAARAAARWARAANVPALFEAVRDELYPEPPAPPHPGTAVLRPLATKADLRRAAKRFRNCLAEQLPYACSGWSAYYEWLGEPGAVVELGRDHIFGWRLEQARLAGNLPVPEPLQEAIASELALIGVHVGRSGWELDRARRSRGADPFPLRPADFAVAEVFGAG